LIAKRLVDQSNLPCTIALAIPEGKPMKYIVFAAAMAAAPAFADWQSPFIYGETA
jgi:hypothetical protein